MDTTDDTASVQRAAELALRLLRLEEELAEYRDLHEQEFRSLEQRLRELRTALARPSETGTEAE